MIRKISATNLPQNLNNDFTPQLTASFGQYKRLKREVVEQLPTELLLQLNTFCAAVHGLGNQEAGRKIFKRICKRIKSSIDSISSNGPDVREDSEGREDQIPGNPE